MPTPAPLNANYISLVSPFVDVKRDFGAQGDGVTDDSTAVQNAINAASTNFGAGTVYFPPGTYLIGTPLTLKSQVHLKGAGIEATIIKLKSATNADLLSANTSSIGLSGSFGSGSTGGIYNWSLQDLTLDGNKAGQSSGTSYCLRSYAYGYILDRVRIRNGYTGGALLDWNGGTTSPGQDNVAAQFNNLKIHDNNGIGLQFGGPHDSQWNNVEAFANGTHNIHIAPNARGLLINNVDSYGVAQGVTGGAVPLLCEANNCQFNNALAQDSDTVQVALLANLCVFIGKCVGGTGNASTSGIQIGQAAGNTPFSGQINQSAGVTTAVAAVGNFIEGILDSNLGSNGQIFLGNDGGQNYIKALSKKASGSDVTGTVAGTTVINTNILPSIGGASATSPAITNGATIATTSAVAKVTPGAAVTGIILQSGVVIGQMCFVDNQGAAANTITFNTSPATSHVSNAAAATAIPGLAGRLYIWDGSFWVPVFA